MKITVVIPAFNRPSLLRTALQSVVDQTASQSIARVIVSENGLNIASKAVCEEFGELPIEYIYQERQLPVLKHLQWIMSQEKDHYVALLCDDDWWDINHLDLAIKALGENTSCLAYFSGFLYLTDELSLKTISYPGTRALHLGKKEFYTHKASVFSEHDILLQSLLVTPFHFSAMVCDGEILRQAVAIFDTVHPTYADRILWIALAGYTAVLYNPINTALIRSHADMDSKNYSSLQWKSATQEGALRILQLAKDKNYDLPSELNKIYATSLPDDSSFISNQLSEIFFNRENISWFIGYKKIVHKDSLESSYKNQVKKVIRKVYNKIF